MTDSERDVLQTLTSRVPLLSLGQLARTWFPAAEAAHALGQLCGSGWLKRLAVNAHPELALEAPLAVWSPGDPAPRFGKISHRNRERWRAEPERTTVFVATEQAASVYGGRAGKAKPLHVSHDIGLGAVYLRLLTERPEDAAAWLSESELAPEREDDVLPDAVLRSPAGELARVIEFVGSSYTAARLEELYLDCETRRVPIEFW